MPTLLNATSSGNNTAATPQDVAYPAYSTGDLIVQTISIDANVTATIPSAGPNGETIITIVANINPGTAGPRTSAWAWVATSNQTAGNISVTLSAAEQTSSECFRVAAGDFNPSAPITNISADGTQTSGTGATITMPSFTSTLAGGRVVAMGGVDADPMNASYTPSGWTSLITHDQGAASSFVAYRDALTTVGETIASADFVINDGVTGDTASVIGFVISNPNVLAPVVSIAPIINTPVIPSDTSITPSSVSVAAAVPAPTVEIVYFVNPAVISVSVSLVNGPFTRITTEWSDVISATTASGGGSTTLFPSSITLLATVGIPTVIASGTPVTSSISISASVPTPVMTTSGTVVPTTVSVAAATYTPTIFTNAQLTANVTAVIAVVGVPDISTTASVVTSVVSISVTVYDDTDYVTFTDDFNRANQALDTSSNWQEIGANGHSIVSNMVYADALDGNDAVTTVKVVDGAVPSYVEFDYIDSTNGTAGRFHMGFFEDNTYVYNSSGNGYAITKNKTETRLKIEKVVNGAITDIAFSSTGLTTAGRIRFEHWPNGDMFGYLNGVLVVSVNNTEVTSLNIGWLSLSTDGNTRIDNLEYGRVGIVTTTADVVPTTVSINAAIGSSAPIADVGVMPSTLSISAVTLTPTITTTATVTPSVISPVVVVDSETIAVDNFNRTNQALTTPWTPITNGFNIITNELYTAFNTGGNNTAVYGSTVGIDAWAEADIWFQTVNSHSGGVTLAGLNNADTHYYFQLQNVNNTINIYRVVNGTGSLLATSAYSVTNQVWRRVRGEVINGVVTMFIDGVEVLSATDNTPLTGEYSGLKAYSFNDGTVRFDNFSSGSLRRPQIVSVPGLYLPVVAVGVRSISSSTYPYSSFVDFETALDGYAVYNGGDQRTTDAAHTGSYSYRLNRNIDIYHGVYITAPQPTNGQTWTLKIWAMTPSTAASATTLYVRHNLKQGITQQFYWSAQTQVVPNDDVWREYTFTFTLNGDTPLVEWGNWWVQSSGAYEDLFVDDISLTTQPLATSTADVAAPVINVPTTIGASNVLVGTIVPVSTVTIAATTLAPTITGDAVSEPSSIVLPVTTYTPTITASSTVVTSSITPTITSYVPTIVSTTNVVPTTVAATASPHAASIVIPDTDVPSSGVSVSAAIFAPAISTSSAVITSTVTPTVSIYAPTVTASTASGSNLVSVYASVPTPSISSNAVVAASFVDVVASPITPTITGDATKAPSPVNISATTLQPTITATSNVGLSALAVSASIPTPVVNAQTSVSVSTVGVISTVLGPSISANATVPTNSVDIQAVVQAPGVQSDNTTTVTASVVAINSIINSPTVSATGRVTTTTVSLSAVTPTPTLDVNTIVQASNVAPIVSVLAPNAVAVTNVSVSAISISSAIGTPILRASASVTPNTVSISTTVLSSGIVTGGNPAAQPVNVSASVLSPIVSTSETAAPSAIVANASIPLPLLVTNVGIQANIVSVSVTAYQVSISTENTGYATLTASWGGLTGTITAAVGGEVLASGNWGSLGATVQAKRQTFAAAGQNLISLTANASATRETFATASLTNVEINLHSAIDVVRFATASSVWGGLTATAIITPDVQADPSASWSALSASATAGITHPVSINVNWGNISASAISGVTIASNPDGTWGVLNSTASITVERSATATSDWGGLTATFVATGFNQVTGEGFWGGINATATAGVTVLSGSNTSWGQLSIAAIGQVTYVDTKQFLYPPDNSPFRVFTTQDGGITYDEHNVIIIPDV